MYSIVPRSTEIVCAGYAAWRSSWHQHDLPSDRALYSSSFIMEFLLMGQDSGHGYCWCCCYCCNFILPQVGLKEYSTQRHCVPIRKWMMFSDYMLVNRSKIHICLTYMHKNFHIKTFRSYVTLINHFLFCVSVEEERPLAGLNTGTSKLTALLRLNLFKASIM